MKKIFPVLFSILLLVPAFFSTGCYVESEPYLGAVGIGVSDIDLSADFYTRVAGMKVKQRIKLCNKVEVVLEFTGSKGSDVILMNYTDGSAPNYKNNPVKLVFYVPDAAAFALAIKQEGLTIVSWPAPLPQFGGVTVGFAKDPDGYLIEIVEDTTATVPYLGAAGIGVSDLASATDFYCRVIGLNVKYSLSLGYMNEVILEFEPVKGSATVVMHYVAPKNYKDLPVKLVYYVTDPHETVKAIRAEGLEVIKEPGKKFNPLNIGLAKDADGYLLEILQSVEQVEKK